MIRVALVDDQALFRAGIRMLVDSQPDLEVVAEASDGREALGVVRAARPDVVLMDIRMPVMDGLAATAELLADPDPPRIVMLTAKGHERDRRKALALGVDDYVTKPFSNRDVIDRVRALLSREQPET